ncbi:MAG TPA: DUF4166 domain-containing protein [Steroidobacteraceae bacterium]|nr:DUF4166 domain-containing protein [Steroidobacteraceae bacterium]
MHTAPDLAEDGAVMRAAGLVTLIPALAEDSRFRNLLPSEDWQRLPWPVRRRFTHALADGETTVFVGAVAETRLSPFGVLVSQFLRLVGGPLPLRSSGRVPATVVVTEDSTCGGQLWTRIYGCAGEFPQVIHSAKRFSGPTGLEECVGRGVGMALTVHVEERALVFRSAWYFLRGFGLAVRLPQFLSPGVVEVVHREECDGRFSFTLTLTHPWFGEALRQVAFFRDWCEEP